MIETILSIAAVVGVALLTGFRPTAGPLVMAGQPPERQKAQRGSKQSLPSHWA
jgi:hypothetical protein